MKHDGAFTNYDDFLNISTLSTKRIAEEYLPRLMMNLAGDLEDEGGR